MKKTSLWMIAALMSCGIALFTMTSCGDDDNDAVGYGDGEDFSEWPKKLDYSQWMQYLVDSRLVADLSLPGAHDAATAEGWEEGNILNVMAEAMAKCQDLTLQQQMEKGVRVFDLRPELVVRSDYELRCSHGPSTTKLLVIDFFRKLKTYLKETPTEFFIVTVQLSNTRKKDVWAEKFNALIHSDEFKGLFADYKPRLTVGEVRGRVLLLSQEKYAEKPLGAYCEGWTSALALETQKQGKLKGADSEGPLWVQDYWENITRENKDAALVRMLEAAAARDMKAAKPAWVINFPSAYIDGPFSDNYRKNAESANALAIKWLNEHKGSVGIIYMDFAGVDKSTSFDKSKEYQVMGMKLVDSVIRQNAK